CQKAEIKLGPVDLRSPAAREEEALGQARRQLKNQFPNGAMPMPRFELGGGVERAELTLVPGKMAEGPTAYLGALRVQAVPIKQAENENIRGHTALLIEVCPEPKLAWRGAADLRFDKLTDDLGQPVEVTRVELSNGKADEEIKKQEKIMLLD